MNNTKSYTLNRRQVSLKQNDIVKCNDIEYIISEIVNFKEVLGINLKTKKTTTLSIDQITVVHENPIDNKNYSTTDIVDLIDDQYNEIEKKYKAILPMINKELTRKEMVDYAESLNIHFTTLYRWLKNYKSSGTLMGLLDKKVGRPKGRKMIDSTTESIITEVFNEYYLTIQKPSIQKVIDLVFIYCKQRNVILPSKNTIRNRINELNSCKVLIKQGNKDIARTKYEPAPNSFEATYPLEIVQIDHTPVDIIIVDSENRLPIGRPWITVAMDIYSRMIVGYYLSLEAPSSTSVAMCITNMVMPKDKILLDNDINEDWSVWGFPDVLHADNGADFRAEALEKACLIHNIQLHFRPIHKTNYGGHIERIIGTLMKQVHSIPGTTYSNIKERQTYDSDGQACMTLEELERWLLTFITKVYHKNIHSTLQMSPSSKWDEAIFGSDTVVGRGFPARPIDNHTILIDFLPHIKRTIQKNGVNIDGINYYDHILRTKIHAIDSKTQKKKKFLFKRDPRDISMVWFYDDDSQEYFKIPAINQALKNMSIWELEASKKILKEKGMKNTNINHILDAKSELHNQIKDSVKKTKKARRDNQRIMNNKKVTQYNKPKEEIFDNHSLQIPSNDFWDDDIPDFK